MTRYLKLPYKPVISGSVTQGQAISAFAPPYPLTQAPVEIRIGQGQAISGGVPRVGELGQGQGVSSEVLTPIVTGFVGQGQGIEGTVLLSPTIGQVGQGQGVNVVLTRPVQSGAAGQGQGVAGTVLPSYVQAAIGQSQSIESQVILTGNVGQGQAISGLLRGQQIEGRVGQGQGVLGAVTAPYFQGSIGQGQGVSVVLPPSVFNGALRRYLDAGVGLTYHPTVVDRVQSWSDRAPLSGTINANNSGTATNCPLYVASGINGKPVLRFNAQLMFGGTMSQFISASAYTAFVVFRPTTITSNNATARFNNPILNSGSPSFGLYLRSTPAVVAYNLDNANREVERPLVATTAPALASFWLENGTLNLQLNNQSTIASVASGNNSNLGTDFRVGEGNNNYQGDIAAILIYNVALSAADRAFVQSYLNDIYALWVA